MKILVSAVACNPYLGSEAFFGWVAVKVLARLTRVPANLAVQWSADAVDLSSLAATQRVQDCLVKVDGRATFVATVPLPEEESEVAGRRQLEIVRIVTSNGTPV